MQIDLAIIFMLLTLLSSGVQDEQWNEDFSQAQLEHAGIATDTASLLRVITPAERKRSP